MNRKNLQDYCLYNLHHTPHNKSKHQRNLRRCIFESFTYKLEDDGIPFIQIGNTLKVLINGNIKVDPVEMSIKYMDVTTQYISKYDLYDALKSFLSSPDFPEASR